MSGILAVAVFIALGFQTCYSKPYDLDRLIGISTLRGRSLGRELAATEERTVRYCSTGPQFAAALAEETITNVFLTLDITLRDDDWTSWALPIKLTRNVSVTGLNQERERWIIFDAGFVKNKVQLGDRVYLTFRFVVINRWREEPHFLAPGMDFIAAGPVPDLADSFSWPAVAVYNVAYIQRTCAPISEQATTGGNFFRPPGFRGNQSTILNVSQPACENKQQQNNGNYNPAVHPLQRCWPSMGLREDVILYSYHLNSASRQIHDGYLVLIFQSYYLCETLMSEQCAKDYTPAGCYWRMFPWNTSILRTDAVGSVAASTPPPMKQVAKGPSNPNVTLAYVLGGALGGNRREHPAEGHIHLRSSLHHMNVYQGVFLLCLVAVILVAIFKTARRRNYQIDGISTFIRIISCKTTGKSSNGTVSSGCNGNCAPNSSCKRAELASQPQTMLTPLGGDKDTAGDQPQIYSFCTQPSSSGHDQGPSAATALRYDSIAGLSLPPVTPLTPLRPDINLNLKMDGGDLQLSAVTLGRGAHGRVVKGMYGGVPVAVKVIDHGLCFNPTDVMQLAFPGLPVSPSSLQKGILSTVMEANTAGMMKWPVNAGGEGAANAVNARAGDGGVAIMPQALITTNGAAGLLPAAAAPPPKAADEIPPPSRTTTSENDDCDDDFRRISMPFKKSDAFDESNNVGRPADREGTSARAAGSVLTCCTIGDNDSGCHQEVDDCNGDDGMVSARASSPRGTAAGTKDSSSRKAVVSTGGVPIQTDLTRIALGPQQAVNDTVALIQKIPSTESHSKSISIEAIISQHIHINDNNNVAARERTSIDDGRGAAGVIRTKEAPPKASEANQLEAAFWQEVEVLARCQHPNIIRLLAACLRPSRICLVMELMETSLDRLIHKCGNGTQELLPIHLVLHIVTQIALGLAYLHPTIMHRDLKPGNVLISHADSCRPVVKLADFGLSRLRNTVLVTRHPDVGTAPYIAPEALDINNFEITDRVDIYALGIIMWEMLAGRRPWQGKNIVVIAFSVTFHRQRPPLQQLSDKRCPPKLRALIKACWDQVPERRPAAADVVKALALMQEALQHSSGRS